MEDQKIEYQRPAWGSVIVILIALLGGFILIGPLIGFLLAVPFMTDNLLDFAAKMSDPTVHPETKVPMFIIQGCATFFGLAVVPALTWWVYEKRNPFELLKSRSFPWMIMLVTGLIVMSFMVTNSIFIEWNSHVKFPDFLKGFESWARKNETLAEQLTTFLTTFDSAGEFVLAFFIISILAGFSEELVFRGLLQPQLFRATHNIHAAIWISAFLFSALHMQFFGFIPRMLLGALFGYLYYWSNNLLVPMFAHALNNGFSVVALYLKQKGKVEIDLESEQAAPWPLVVLFTAILVGLLFYFFQFYKTRNATLT
jgi:membrane protease YdiL (CAAX protease family)